MARFARSLPQSTSISASSIARSGKTCGPGIGGRSGFCVIGFEPHDARARQASRALDRFSMGGILLVYGELPRIAFSAQDGALAGGCGPCGGKGCRDMACLIGGRTHPIALNAGNTAKGQVAGGGTKNDPRLDHFANSKCGPSRKSGPGCFNLYRSTAAFTPSIVAGY